MIPLNLISSNIYSCQFCNKEFETTEIYQIVVGISPVCSDYCFFRIVYNILSQYDNEQLQNLNSLIKTLNISSQGWKGTIFDNSKIYKKLILSSIKREVINYQNVI